MYWMEKQQQIQTPSVKLEVEQRKLLLALQKLQGLAPQEHRGEDLSQTKEGKALEDAYRSAALAYVDYLAARDNAGKDVKTLTEEPALKVYEELCFGKLFQLYVLEEVLRRTKEVEQRSAPVALSHSPVHETQTTSHEEVMKQIGA